MYFFNFENFTPCVKCYSDCFSLDFLRCSVCRRGCHRSCLKISEKRFIELSKYEEHMYVCSDKCRIKKLPFQELTNKVFLDTVIGRRKIPCKICFRECAKSKNCAKCIVCMRSQHTYCIPVPTTHNIRQNSSYDYFVCSNRCELRLLPFSKLNDLEFYNEIFCIPVHSPDNNVVDKVIAMQPKSPVVSNFNKYNDNDCANNSNLGDKFSQVYCEYVNANEVPGVLNEGDPNNISVFHANAISLKKNLHAVEGIFRNCQNYPSIIAISETGLKSKINDNTVALAGYDLERHDSKTNKGGVALYIEDDIDYTVREDLGFKVRSCEDLWVEIKPPKNKNNSKTKMGSFIVGVIYRHPNTSYSFFSSRMCQIIEKLNKENKRFMIVGDININLLKFNLARKVTDYVNGLKSSGCNIHCKLPTRIYKNSISCIDHVYSNIDQQNVETSVILSDISDHFSTLTKIVNSQHFHKRQKDLYKRKFKISNVEKQNLLYDVKTFFESPPIQRLKTCPNVMANITTQFYQNVVEKYFPFKVVPKKALKFVDKPWFTKGIKISITNKNRLRYKMKGKYSEEAEIYYKRYRNILANLKTKAYNMYYTEKATAAQNNISKSWAIVNEIVKRKKSRETKISSIYNDEGKEVTDETEILNLINRHFSTIGTTMASNISHSNIDPLRYVKHDKPSSFFMKSTTLEEILKLIDSLDSKKAPGSDGVPCYLIKLTRYIIAPILCDLFNTCMRLSVFPDIFKIAEVKSLFKGGDRRVKGNYRPISLLPLFSKLFEKVIAKRLRSYFEANDILTYHQFGFRKSHSTELAVTNLYDSLLKKLDEKDITCAIFLDLAKAFDSVNHTILLQKLEKYGIRGIPLKFLESYLSNRWQYVKLNGKCSDLERIEIGVPQGSILGPLLFLLYINDLPNASNFFVKLFADDTFLSLSSQNFDDLKKKTNSEMKKVYSWLIANKLTLNVKKSKFMIISKRKGVNTNCFKLKINGVSLEKCSSYKYLGLLIDDGLTWKEHVKHVCQKLSKACGIISKIRHCVNINTLKTIYYALGYSYIRYCNIVWGNATKNTLKPLMAMQNRLIRIMTFAPFGRIDIDDLYLKLRLLGLEKIHYLEKSKFMYKYYNNKLPAYFNNYFENRDTISHSYNLRNRNPPRRILSTYAEKMIKNNGYDIWNTIPTNIKNCKNLKSFSEKLKKEILLV